MHELSLTLKEEDFPELVDLPFAEKARFLQGTLLQQGLIFQVASGYLTTDSPEFKESWRLASELKTLQTKQNLSATPRSS
jgi:hypothetical protein